jgi:phosphotransferase system IIB component
MKRLILTLANSNASIVIPCKKIQAFYAISINKCTNIILNNHDYSVKETIDEINSMIDSLK